MKRIRLNKESRLNNMLRHQETRDEVWDYMASRWAAKAERVSSYGKSHLPKPVKNVIRRTIQKPINATKSFRAKRNDNASKTKFDLRFSNASK